LQPIIYDLTNVKKKSYNMIVQASRVIALRETKGGKSELSPVSLLKRTDKKVAANSRLLLLVSGGTRCEQKRARPKG